MAPRVIAVALTRYYWLSTYFKLRAVQQVACMERHFSTANSLLKIASWALSNICDGQPAPLTDIQAIMPAVAKLLQHSDAEVLSHSCWAVSHLCDGPTAHIKAVVEAEVCCRLVALLSHSSWKVAKPALRTVS
jgi:hypothetical protein